MRAINHLLMLLAAIGLLALPAAAQNYTTVVVHDTSGYPANPERVEGGQPFAIRYISPGHWVASGIRVTLDKPTIITGISGVMIGGGWASPGTQLVLNIHSSEAAFGAAPLTGDVASINGVTFSNLNENNSAPLWGGLNSHLFYNFWLEMDVPPTEIPAGSYVFTLQAYNSSNLPEWTETLYDYGHPSDIFTTGSKPPGHWEERADHPIYTTGNAAVRIVGKQEDSNGPPPGDLNGDGVIDGFDLLAMLGCWGVVIPGCESADITGGREGEPDGTVDGFDLLMLLGNWGPYE